MTTLIAYQGDGYSVIAADSQTTYGNLGSDCSPMGKIAQNGKFLVAAAGTVRGMNLIQHSFIPPALPTRMKNVEQLDKYMVTKFLPALRKCFVDAGYDMKEDGDIATHDNDFIVCVNGILYFIDGAYGLERNRENIHITGSGKMVAVGAADALGISHSPDYQTTIDILERAVKSAIKYDIYSGNAVQMAIQYDDGTTFLSTLEE